MILIRIYIDKQFINISQCMLSEVIAMLPIDWLYGSACKD